MHTLYEKLKLAAKYNMPADDVKIIIDEAPILDTIYERDKYTLMIADLELKETLVISVADIRKALRVIYWKINDAQYDVSIAGLGWMQDNKAAFFSGKVLTP